MANHSWYGPWLQRKHKYAASDEPFMDADLFHSLAAGKGLPPIHQVSTFPFHNVADGASRFLGVSKGGERPYARIYTRMGNPTTEHLERVLFQLECQHIIDKALAADEKTPTIGVLICSSGMAAISCTLLSLLQSGDEVIAGNVYGCTDSLLRSLEHKFGIKTHWVDMTDTAQVKAVLEAHPRVAALFLESPDNPTLAISDLRELSKLCERHQVPLIVDNTFASSYLQQPFRLGADVVVHSMTKYINGHSSSVGGCIVGPFKFMQETVFPIYKDLGPTPSPFESWLNALCLQDLGRRVDAASRSAQQLAEFLEAHKRIARVRFPFLASHPQHALARSQMRMGGAMISFDLDGGMEPAKRLMNFFAGKDTPMELAVSLGCAVSYIEHPASMTHAGIPREDRLKRGLGDELVRLSVGLEGAAVLVASLGKGLKKAYR